MNKHTPGPWEIDNCDWPLIVNGPETATGENLVCVIERKREGNRGYPYEGATAQANALLIAAAPAMFEAGQALLEFWDNGTPVHPGADVVSDLRRVIAKAQANR